MPSMRCTLCGIDYPTGMQRCPVCEEQTWFNKNGTPDELWEWEAESLRQKRMAGEEDGPYVGLQPYFLKVPMTEVIHVPDPDEEEEGGPNRAHLRAIPAISLVDVYSFRNAKLLLKADDVVEIPNPDYRGEATPKEPVTRLYEVQGTFRGSSTTLYMLQPLDVADTFPEEWVTEFYRGD